MKMMNQKGQSMVMALVFLTVMMGMSALVLDVGSWYRAHRAAQSTADASALAAAQGLPDTKVGTFTQDLYDEAKKDGWIVISMKNDWKRIFGFDSAP